MRGPREIEALSNFLYGLLGIFLASAERNCVSLITTHYRIFHKRSHKKTQLVKFFHAHGGQKQ